MGHRWFPRSEPEQRPRLLHSRRAAADVLAHICRSFAGCQAVVGPASSAAIRSVGLVTATVAGQERLHDRDQALQLAREKPALAREVGVGRPDQPGAVDAGLVDVNNAPASALTRLPGVDDGLATRIIEVRTQTNGFSSLEDLGSVLDLAGDQVERLRDRAVFLPR